MIHSEKEYRNAMRMMILRVQRAADINDIDTWALSMEEAELLLDCVRDGYLTGKVPEDETSCRTLDGKAHPELINTVVTPKGLSFLRPSKTDLKSSVALGVSIFAAVISLFAFVVTLLANLDKVIQNCAILAALLGA